MYQDAKDDRKNSSGQKLTRTQCLFLLATIFGAGFLIFCRNDYIEKTEFNDIKTDPHGSTWNKKLNSNIFKDRFAIDTEGCSIPGFKPLDKAIEQYVFYPQVKPCRNSTRPLLGSNRTHIWIKEDNRKYYSKTGSKRILCCYKSFYRPAFVNDVSSIDVDDRVKYNECISFSKNIKVNDEFVKVECTNKKKVIFIQFFSFTPLKNISHKGVQDTLYKTPGYNVLVLGIDTVSRLNIYRTMPKTLKFLKNKGAVELFGYNKVGDNTFPNVIPMLLGIDSWEIKRTCLPSPWSTFDNCPFIWEWYKQAGYYTALGEDTSRLGTFNYLRTGFIGTPTDYYLHTFINEAERNVGNNKDFNTYLCMNEKFFYNVLLNYIEDLAMTLQFSKLFGFFWEATMSHDYLNYPMIIDSDYERFLHKLDISKYLEKTIIFLVSDHGIRWGKIRSTKQGKLEERLPFVYILAPQSFRNNYSEAYKNLQINSRRLTTPFDVHATLQDLVDLDNIKDEQIQARGLSSYGLSRSISLFLPIPTNRTCEMAKINPHWCTCQKSRKLSLDSAEAVDVASQLMRQLNELIIDYSQCSTLRLVEIIDVAELDYGTHAPGKVESREFMVVIRTEPGSGIFEATLLYDKQDWSLAGTISRLNLYGNQSHCISDSQLKLYCFCI